MSRENRMDRIMDMIKTRLTSVNTEIVKQFKNTNPYRMVKVSDEERITKYLSITPDMDLELSQQLGQVYQNYKLKMDNLIKGYKNA
jgi:hypothetical protein